MFVFDFGTNTLLAMTTIYPGNVFFLLMQSAIFEIYLTILSWVPAVIPEGMRLLFIYGDPLPPYNRVDVSHKVFNIPNYIPMHNEAELVVDVGDCAAAIRELKAFVVGENIPLNYLTEVTTNVLGNRLQ